MKTLYKILLIFILIPLTISATERKGKYTKNKVLTKEYSVHKNATLNVSNKYGNIGIATWNENRIVIKVSITTNGDDEEKVAKRIEQIDVEFSGNTTNVSAKTIIEKNSSSWNLWGKRNNVNMEINYLIQMPISNNVDLNNDYGAISLDKLEGSAQINCDYGKITIGELRNTTNSINIDYTNKSTIDLMQGGAVNADYSTLHIDRSNRIDLNADYSHMSFGMVAVLDYNCDYGSLKIGDSGNVTGKSDYMHTSVEKLRGTGDFDMDYGSLKIEELGKEFKDLIVKSSYTNTKIGVQPNINFTLNATLNYGNLKYKSGFTINKEIIKTSSKYYEGYYNSNNTVSNITIKSSYGTISFY
ncbi:MULTISPECIES: hypothetical protein [Flavobacteriaceae]|uniref:Adhesin domain-containing protein n=2 Tax=Flavobacteriaceae TaxID=49546 RepID=A0A4Y8AWD9_9FLAO|nr:MULTISPECIES: hypothetical protein [Flavobacteriaceae]TEW76840.1 hypothetical protein E2488_03050 [Gramella jeungdoensis]GGK49574.1 hypothetical protein GCM10007963_17420 [Lutibacter litoralis]